jgi:hypothetical protein
MCDAVTAVKKVVLGKPDGGMKTEGPKLRWLDCFEKDLKSMGVNGWWKKQKKDLYGLSS